MNVYLLTRKGRKGKSSYYLLYVNGKYRKTETLNLKFFDKPKDHLERGHNKNVHALAKTIHSQKILDCQYNNHGLISPIKGKVGLLSFFDSIMETKQDSPGTYGNWKSVKKHLSAYLNGHNVQLEKVDDVLISGFQEYLLKLKTKHGKQLSRNAALSYFIKLKVVLKAAWQKKYIKNNPAVYVKCIMPEERARNFVTMDELRRLVDTPCKRPEVKAAFLFSALTGLRSSDVKALTWEQIQYSKEGGYQITYTQKKTKSAEVLPICPEAYTIIERFKDREGEVFKRLIISDYTNKFLHQWFKDAGITKKLTYHSSRHSFASNMLATKAADIYVVSKLLGHKRLATTEIYSKILHESKVDAVNRLTLSPAGK